MKSIRSKIIFLLIVISVGMGLAVTILSADIYANYKELQVSECRSMVDFASERINKKIRELRENAKSIALCGYLYYSSPQRVSALAEDSVKAHFRTGAVAVGGGIWFDPNVVFPDKKRVCFYAFNNGTEVVIDTGFLSDEYDYHTQIWYRTIKPGVKGPGDVAWSPPYFDMEGTKALMTTAGAGIFDKDGKLVGISTVDWELDAIALEISRVRPTENSFSLFADKRSDYILALTDKDVSGNPIGKSLKILEWFDARDDAESRFTYHGVKYISFRRVLDNGMTMVINVPENELFSEVNLSAETSVAALVISCVFMAGLMYLVLNHLVTRPIAYLSQKALEIGAGNFDTKIFLNKKDEFGNLAYTLNMMAKDINAHIHNLESITAEKQSIVGELDLAKEMQASMLFSIFPPESRHDGFSVCASKVPSKAQGGDFFDYFYAGGGKIAVVISDVSAIGVPATLFMMIVRALVKNYAQLGLEPADVLSKVNALLSENMNLGVAAGAFVGVLDLHTGLFSCASAGGRQPCIARAGAGFMMLDVPEGAPLGLKASSKYAQSVLDLKKGDRIFLYTGGVIGAANAKGEAFGEMGMLDALNKSERGDAQGIVFQLRSALSDFSGGAVQGKDITMLALEYLGEKPQR